ncbi:uncharacterized protein B0T15DRAFT_122038 [Chaetomium strumarium]|uniref:Uncharacterized protein n=1 Tax=Chaetomium strumarium TaxID=1170767 RepID=A0AAJ0GZA6_9PEZI|nr:hypothetical protein B0T15DRAFT_122038 [Chaetomium strumarium]
MIPRTICLLALLLPLASAEVLGSYTIPTFARNCTADACTYRLALEVAYNNSTEVDATENDQTNCTFTVRAVSPLLAANITNFKNVTCDEDERYRFNGGFNVTGGFLTLVPTDTVAGTYAFFGYSDSEMEAGEVGPRTVDAYRVGTFGDDEWDDGQLGFAASDGREVKEVAVMKRGAGVVGAAEEDPESWWEVRRLTRTPVIQSNTTKTEMVEFSIADVDAGTQTNCTVNLLNQGLTASWYGKPCGLDFRWSISWGYNSDADSAVMTVCYVSNGTAAWFGYEKISNTTSFGDSVKEPVWKTGCR